MPGFGRGEFGGSGFGSWKWSRWLFWDELPELDRIADPDNGGYLEMWQSATASIFDDFLSKIRNLEDLRDPLAARSQYDDVIEVRLGKELRLKDELTQRGIDGSVLTLGAFAAATARFDDKDLNRLLTITKSAVPTNNRVFEIVAIVSRTSVVTEPLITVDAGPLEWEVHTRLTAEDGSTFEVVSGDTSIVAPGSVLFDGETQFTITARRRFPAESGAQMTESYGGDGLVTVAGNFVSPRGPFQVGDIGKRLSIKGLLTFEEDGKYEIYRAVSAQEVELVDGEGNAVVLTADAGPLEWSILQYPQVDISGVAIPLGIVEQGDVDLAVTAPSTASSAKAAFSDTDVGKQLEIRNSALGNDGLYEIATVVDENTATVTAATLVNEAGLLWRLRTPTGLDDLSKVEIRPFAILPVLAQDFNIEVDSQHTEDRQRSWVRFVSAWVKLKGTVKAYWAIAALNGFEAEVFALYRIAQGLSSQVPSSSLVELGEPAVGRSGTDGTLFLGGSGKVRLSAPTAAFKSSDTGRQIRIRDAAAAPNNKLYTIESFVSATEFEFRSGDTAIFPEGNNGALSWSIVRLYTTKAPTIPLFDETRQDLVNEIVESESGSALHFLLDQYCWEDDWSSDIPVTIQSASQVSSLLYDIVVVNRTGDYANTSIGTGGIDGTVDITVDVKGAAGNLLLAEVVYTVAPNLPLLATFVSPQLTIRLGTDALSFPDATKNSAGQVFTSINLIPAAVGVLTATLPGTGLLPLTVAEANKFFTGGADEFEDAPEVVVEVGRWKLIDSAGEEFFLETVPAQTAVGPPAEYTLQIGEALPPTLGAGFLRYECDVQLSCRYCAASKILLEVTLGDVASEGARAVEKLWERLLLRLEQVTPAHVELIVQRTQELEATIGITAELEAGLSWSSTLYAPLTVYDSEVDADFYPVDTMLTAEVEAPAFKATFRGVATLTLRGRVT